MMQALADFTTTHTLFLGVLVFVLIVAIGTIFLGIRSHPPIPPEMLEMLRNADDVTKQRMWEHLTHEDDTFGDRQNFFLVFESVLFGVMGAIYTKPGADVQVVRLIALFGLAVTLLWFYIQVRQLYVIESLKARDRVVFDEYKFAVQQRRRWPFHIMGLLAYVLPLLIAFAWVALLAFLEGWHFGL